MLYHVINRETADIIVSYDVATKAKQKAEELNKQYQTSRYQII
jgi:hypothetical protein